MEGVIKIGVAHARKPRPAVLVREVKIRVVSWIEERPTCRRILGAGVGGEAVNGVNFVACVQQCFHEVSAGESSAARHECFTHVEDIPDLKPSSDPGFRGGRFREALVRRETDLQTATNLQFRRSVARLTPKRASLRHRCIRYSLSPTIPQSMVRARPHFLTIESLSTRHG